MILMGHCRERRSWTRTLFIVRFNVKYLYLFVKVGLMISVVDPHEKQSV